MIKRTLYFGNAAYLSLRYQQMIVKLPAVESSRQFTQSFKKESETSIPIEDIGIMILDHTRITITQALISELLQNNAALITCNGSHHPTGLMLNLDGHTLQAKKFSHQIAASVPLKKQLWQQTIKHKINNQARVLEKQQRDGVTMLRNMSKQVRSGDPENFEGRAAAVYWQHLFGEDMEFTRNREGMHPNSWLNYGYAILRAGTARSLVGSGLLPTLGIHHRNQYNAYCLADDIMEPYRPYVDEVICKLLKHYPQHKGELPRIIKQELLQIPVLDVHIDNRKSPLMVAMQQSTSSLSKCFEGKEKRIKYPILE